MRVFGAVVLAIVLLVGGSVFFACVERVAPGYEAVVYSTSGGMKEETLPAGWHLLALWERGIPYTIGNEQSYMTADSFGDSREDESFFVPTSDGKPVRVEVEFSYHFDRTRLPEIFQRFKGADGKTVKETFIKPKIRAWSGEVTEKYSTSGLYGGQRAEINAALTEHLAERFTEYGIVIDTMSLTKVYVDDETYAAIQRKVAAQLDIETKSSEAEVARVKAEGEREVARIEAEQELIRAQAKADAEIIEAKAQAEGNRVIAESLTPNLIQYEQATRWNGVLPEMVGGQMPLPIVNVAP